MPFTAAAIISLLAAHIISVQAAEGLVRRHGRNIDDD